MQYDLQKLERMTLDEVREIAVNMGLSPKRSQSLREISYAILDAQADKRAAITQAKEDERIAAGLPTKRERARGVRRAATKINTSNLKGEQVLATVGTEKEQMAEMQEQLKANNHKPNKTVINVKGGKVHPQPILESQEAESLRRREEVKRQKWKVERRKKPTPNPPLKGRAKKALKVERRRASAGEKKRKAKRRNLSCLHWERMSSQWVHLSARLMDTDSYALLITTTCQAQTISM